MKWRVVIYICRSREANVGNVITSFALTDRPIRLWSPNRHYLSSV